MLNTRFAITSLLGFLLVTAAAIPSPHAASASPEEQPQLASGPQGPRPGGNLGNPAFIRDGRMNFDYVENYPAGFGIALCPESL